MQTAITLLSILVILTTVGAAVLTIVAALRAPLGEETEDGFHELPEPASSRPAWRITSRGEWFAASRHSSPSRHLPAS